MTRTVAICLGIATFVVGWLPVPPKGRLLAADDQFARLGSSPTGGSAKLVEMCGDGGLVGVADDDALEGAAASEDFL